VIICVRLSLAFLFAHVSHFIRLQFSPLSTGYAVDSAPIMTAQEPKPVFMLSPAPMPRHAGRRVAAGDQERESDDTGATDTAAAGLDEHGDDGAEHVSSVGNEDMV
jgi:hypothetical protein